MPAEFSKDLVALLTYLLPGFLAAWIFYGLTSHPKPSQFERVVQALVFTFLIQALVPVVRWSLEYAGNWIALAPWSKASEGLAALALAVVFGGVLAHCTNNDTIHKWLRKAGFTTRTSHPSEWYCVLSQKVMFVILHLNDGRRLYGWPKEWPVEADKGQFYLMLPCWIQEDGSSIDLAQLDGILVHARDVKWVEFVSEVGATA
ncbi:DUF6338 family protein [Alkalilimnicola sp. S0819]|uniref:DUF6338 family protein n=1 Tax=Alkalilimnicola sp. S0819 TaxID=2613922 RepID=UPI001262908A|nr:DUF6338 family protein [Alkalilimnicola sp. S0819]KAB7627748.1 hypothetical protein F3N43_01855 [Alkalilimnicola sp. S0819]MPQ15371.1 hypothetical protein [Alkalilimnicola sp. S0819]